MASLGEIYPYDRRSQDQMDALLLAEGIRRDKNLDYSCGVFDEDGTLIATGSRFKNTDFYYGSLFSAARHEGRSHQSGTHTKQYFFHNLLQVK